MLLGGTSRAAVLVSTALLVGVAAIGPVSAQTPPPAPASDGPKVTKIVAIEGPTSGGSTVMITGTSFNRATAVTFDGVPALSFNVGPPPDSPTAVYAVAPPHASGKTVIRVTTPAGTSPPGPESTFTYQATRGAWDAVPARPRFSHTATRLRDGKVLVAGGCVETEPTGRCFKASATVEVYDPAHRRWSGTADMTDARIGHVATLLPNGKVLVAGGCSVLGCQPACTGAACATGPVPSQSSAEVYDPATGRWAPTGPMALIQQTATAVALPPGPGPGGACGPSCGKVLLVGAAATVAGEPLPTDGAQLYDPATATWAATAPPEYPRIASSAVLLPTGKVLVAGALSGTAGGGAAAPGELFDPATATWSPTGNAEPNAGITETLTALPDGRVLAVATGLDKAKGGELYDPTALPDPSNPSVRGGKWTTVGPLNVERYGNTATLLPDGTVLVAGGGDNPPVATAELYRPKTATWAPAATMAGARGLHPPIPIQRPTFTATLLKDGTVLVVGASYRADTLRTYFPGGYSFNKLSSSDAYGPSAELYTPAAGRSGPSALVVVLVLAAVATLAVLVVVNLRRRQVAGDTAPGPAPGSPPQA